MATKNALVTVNSVIRAQERNTPQKQPGMQGWHAGALPWSTPVTSFLKDNVILIYNSSKDGFTWFWIPYKWNHTTVHFSCLVALAHSAGSDFLLYVPVMEEPHDRVQSSPAGEPRCPSMTHLVLSVILMLASAREGSDPQQVWRARLW